MTPLWLQSCNEAVGYHIRNPDAEPFVAPTLSPNLYLQIIVAERFGRLCITPLKSDHVQPLADKPAPEFQVLPCRQVAQNAVAFPGHMHRKLIRHCRRSRPRARRIGKHVQVCKRQSLEETAAFFEK